MTGNQMKVVLITEKSVDFTFNEDPWTQDIYGKCGWLLQDRSSDAESVNGLRRRYSWNVESLEDSGGGEGFKLRLDFHLEKGKYLNVHVDGDFRDILKHVFGIIANPWDMKIKLHAVVTLLDGAHSLCILHDEIGAKVYFGGNLGFLCEERRMYNYDTEHFVHGSTRFETQSTLDLNFAKKFKESTGKTSSAKVTIELLGGEMVPLPSPFSSGVALEELNRSILDEKTKSDFVLVSNTGVEFPCHKNFLEATCPSFDQMFELKMGEDGNPTNSSKLNLSEEGMKAFLEFVYCLKIEAPLKDSNIALELLQVGIEKEIPALRQTMTTLILVKVDDWFDLDGALQLFFLCGQVDAYDAVKRKAVKAIKLKRNQFNENSEVCNELFKKYPEAAVELFRSVLKQ